MRLAIASASSMSMNWIAPFKPLAAAAITSLICFVENARHRDHRIDLFLTERIRDLVQ